MTNKNSCSQCDTFVYIFVQVITTLIGILISAYSITISFDYIISAIVGNVDHNKII